jgi:hypothetical protein
MTREEIIAQFQGNNETTPTVYVFNGNLSDLEQVAATSIKTFGVQGTLYFMSLDPEYVPVDSRMEIL